VGRWGRGHDAEGLGEVGEVVVDVHQHAAERRGGRVGAVPLGYGTRAWVKGRGGGRA
jgi:hypothetical protein